MSRYIARTKRNEQMAFGYDRPLQEYFCQVFDKDDELISDVNSSGMSMVPGKSTKPVKNSDMYDLIKTIMCDHDWKKYQSMVDNILLDLPF